MALPPKAILIDFDGTLVDSHSFLYQTYCDYLARFGHIGCQEEFQELNGRSLGDVRAILANRYGIAESSPQVYVTLEDYVSGVPLFPGALEVISSWRRAGIVLAIVTAAGRVLVESYLKQHQLTELFQTVVTADCAPLHKPNPDLFLQALKRIGCPAAEAIAIEDSLNGIKAALAAQLPTIAVNFAPRLAREEADLFTFDSKLFGKAHSWAEVSKLIPVLGDSADSEPFLTHNLGE